MKLASTRRWIVFGALVTILLAVAGPALAHATYKSSNPADESTVSSPPGEITAEFTEPMSSGSYMDVTDPCGRDSGSGSTQTGSSMSVQNSSTAAGTYVVFWRAASIDGHVTEGEFTFTSSGGEPCPGEEEKDDSTTGGGGGGGNGGGSGSSGGGANEDAGSSSTDPGSSKDHGGHSRDQQGKHGTGVMIGNRDREKAGGSDATDDTTLAGGARTDVPEPPSALEGIPIDGLIMTLAVSALIGAAAGKIYVSLSGDGS